MTMPPFVWVRHGALCRESDHSRQKIPTRGRVFAAPSSPHTLGRRLDPTCEAVPPISIVQAALGQKNDPNWLGSQQP